MEAAWGFKIHLIFFFHQKCWKVTEKCIRIDKMLPMSVCGVSLCEFVPEFANWIWRILMVDWIFKNDDRISTKWPPKSFWVRGLWIYCQINEILYGRPKSADETFINNGKISKRSTYTDFWGRWLWIYCRSYEIWYGGYKMANDIFKYDNKISTICVPMGFWSRWLRIYCHIHKIQYAGFKKF